MIARLVVILALWAGDAVARPAALTAAEAAFADPALWDQVEPLLADLIAAPTTPLAIRVEALLLRGQAQWALGDVDAADASFRAAVELDVEAQLPPGTSSSLRAALEAVRARHAVEAEVALRRRLGARLDQLAWTVRAPTQGRGGRPLTWQITVDDPTGEAAVATLSYRRAGTTYFATQQVPIGAAPVTLRIPGESTASARPYVLETVIRLRTTAGEVLRAEGSFGAPRSIAVAAGQVPGWRPPAWAWVAAGAAVVGGLLLAREANDAGPQTVRVMP